MASFTNRIAALRELSTELDNFAAKVGATMSAAQQAVQGGTDQILGHLDRMGKEGNPKLADFKRQLEDEAEHGNAWTAMLLDLIHQVEQGTIRADQAFHKFGDGVVLFEGHLTKVDDLLAQFLPTTGEVQQRIVDLAQALKGADIGTLVEHLKEQYNQYAVELAKAVEAFKAGQGSLERIMELASQIHQRLGGSETDALAQLLSDGLLNGQL